VGFPHIPEVVLVQNYPKQCILWISTFTTDEINNFSRVVPQTGTCLLLLLRGGANKSLARPGRKQATVTRLAIYSTYSPRNSIHFLARCPNYCQPLKKNSEGSPSNQVSAAAMTSMLDKKWWPFNCFFQSREQMVVQRGQIWRTG